MAALISLPFPIELARINSVAENFMNGAVGYRLAALPKRQPVRACFNAKLPK